MPSRGHWTAADLAMVFTMWAIMMVAMMLPTAVPMLLTYRRLLIVRGLTASPAATTSVFAAGYLCAWTVFSVLATLAQWQLHNATVLSPDLALTTPAFAGVLLMAAGVYQLTPFKQVCLEHCRSPHFLLLHWRDGAIGAFRMGVHHGVYCIGCCWLLMAILFVVGVMNVMWVAAITLLVLAEKALPGGPWLARLGGLALLFWGGALLWMA
jgi:predicted metal-binding membrane protein